MAVTVTELFDSRPVQTREGLSFGRRSFVVYDLATPITEPVAVYALFGTNGLPNYNDQFPNAAIPFVAVNPTVAKMEGQPDVWRVDWEYTETKYGALQVKNPQEVGYVDVSASVGGEPVEAWRSISAATISALTASGAHYAFGTPANDNVYDIGGRPIDVAGESVSRLVRSVSCSFSITVSTPPKLGDVAAYIGRRNSVAFNGAGVGRVLYQGFATRRISKERWSVEHRFVLDEWLHMRQQPIRLPDGSPILGSFSTGGVRAQYVNFVQPFPDLADFYQISPYLIGVA